MYSNFHIRETIDNIIMKDALPVAECFSYQHGAVPGAPFDKHIVLPE